MLDNQRVKKIISFVVVCALLGCTASRSYRDGFVDSQNINDVYVTNFDATVAHGAMFVKGTLVNHHGATISNVEIEARAYDKNNQLVSTDSVVLAPSSIKDNEKVNFSVTFTKNVGQIETYYLLGKYVAFNKKTKVDWDKVGQVVQVVLVAAAVTAVALAVVYAAQEGGGDIRSPNVSSRGYYRADGEYIAPRYFRAPDEYLGRFSANQYAADSVSNPYGAYGSPYSSKSINNPYGSYGNPYSAKSANNPYAINPPKIYSRNGQYLGKLSKNPYDPDSTSNPYGRHGSPYSSDSVNNPYGQFGSKYSSQSANNPYASDPPIIRSDEN